jgi:hypothetical protein
MQERRFSPAEISAGHPSRRIRLMGARFAVKNADIQPFYTHSNEAISAKGSLFTNNAAAKVGL